MTRQINCRRLYGRMNFKITRSEMHYTRKCVQFSWLKWSSALNFPGASLKLFQPNYFNPCGLLKDKSSWKTKFPIIFPGNIDLLKVFSTLIRHLHNPIWFGSCLSPPACWEMIIHVELNENDTIMKGNVPATLFVCFLS